MAFGAHNIKSVLCAINISSWISSFVCGAKKLVERIAYPA